MWNVWYMCPSKSKQTLYSGLLGYYLYIGGSQTWFTGSGSPLRVPARWWASILFRRVSPNVNQGMKCISATTK